MSKRKIKIAGLVLCALMVGIVAFILMLPSTAIKADATLLSIEVNVAGSTHPTIIDNGDGTYTYKDKWLCSYETILFDTPSGDMESGFYAPDENGKGYYYRTRPTDEAQFDWTDDPEIMKNLNLYSVRVDILPGHAYYDEFLTAEGATNWWAEDSVHAGKDPSELPSGSVLRIQSSAEVYWDTANIKNYPQPERSETIDYIPPVEPAEPPPEHHSIALDTVSNSGGKSFVSNYSWSHTCTGANGLLTVADGHYALTQTRQLLVLLLMVMV